MATEADVLNALADFPDPCRGRVNLVELGEVADIAIEDSTARVTVHWGYPADGLRESLEQALTDAIRTIDGIDTVALTLDWRVQASPVRSGIDNLAEVRNIIAVASGKGGVGKSTTAVNLALALRAEGARVGLLDADIYGPSQQCMLGVPEGQRPDVEDEKFFHPVMAHGLQTMSMGFLVTEQTPMVWRGPMVSGALQQLLNQTRWDDVDYLIVDMPPGTGDIQLTLSQHVPVTGAVIVTTPQDIALLDARKGIEMFRKVHVPVLGIIENMATHVCSACGHEESIFGEGGGERIAAEYGVTLLGQLPLDRHIREQTDGGTPSVVVEPDGAVARAYREIARALGARLSLLARERPAGPAIEVSND